MENVVPLHDKKSKFDFTHKGELVRFEIVPAHGHMDIMYFIEKEIDHPFTGSKMKHRERLFHRCVELKWYEKIVGMTYEKKILKEVRKYRKFVAEVEAAEKLGQDISEALEKAEL